MCKIYDYEDIIKAYNCQKIPGIFYLKNKRLEELTEANLKKVTKFIADSSLTDDDLKYLENLTSLEELNLVGTKITDNGLKYLQKLTNLTELDLKITKITDKGVQYLKKLTNLEELNIEVSELTDSQLIRTQKF